MPQVQISKDQRRLVLRVLAEQAGDCVVAAERLREDHGMQLNEQSVRGYKIAYRNEYADAADTYAPVLEADLVREVRETAYISAKATRTAVEKARVLLPNLTDPAEAARVAKDLTVSQVQATNELLTLTGRPTEIKETRGVREILAGLAAKGVIKAPPKQVKNLAAGDEDGG